MEREFLEGLKIGEESLPQEVIDAIWEQHSKALSASRLHSAVELAITKAGGRNVKAICALLDMDTIAQSEDSAKALEQALAKVKKDSEYLFEAATPPPYARFTGAGQSEAQAPQTLASALRERMRK